MLPVAASSGQDRGRVGLQLLAAGVRVYEQLSANQDATS